MRLRDLRQFCMADPSRADPPPAFPHPMPRHAPCHRSLHCRRSVSVFITVSHFISKFIYCFIFASIFYILYFLVLFEFFLILYCFYFCFLSASVFVLRDCRTWNDASRVNGGFVQQYAESGHNWHLTGRIRIPFGQCGACRLVLCASATQERFVDIAFYVYLIFVL